jgi:hypothetical protein
MISSGPYIYVVTEAQYTEFVAGTGIAISGTLLIFYFSHVMELFNGIPWMKIEMGLCGLWTIFFLASGIALARIYWYTYAFGFGSFFSFAAMCVYGYDGYRKYLGWKSGELVQGSKPVSR